MLATCPHCAFQAEIEAFFTDDDGKRLAAVMIDIPPECGRAVLAYLRLFKPPKTGLRAARAVKLAREVAAQGPWASRIGEVRHPDRHSIDWYYALLQPLCSRVDAWRTTYMHPLANHEAVVEWFKGSALRPFLAQLDAQEQAQYLANYLAAIRQAYPALPSGTVLLPFPRIFIVATR